MQLEVGWSFDGVEEQLLSHVLCVFCHYLSIDIILVQVKKNTVVSRLHRQVHKFCSLLFRSHSVSTVQSGNDADRATRRTGHDD